LAGGRRVCRAFADARLVSHLRHLVRDGMICQRCRAGLNSGAPTALTETWPIMLIDCLPPESPLWHRGRGSIRAERHNGFQDVDQWAKNKEGAALPFGSAQDKKDAAVRLNLMPKNEKGG
jgi:hypothetical protein